MSEKEYVIVDKEDLVAIGNVVRELNGGTAPIVASSLAQNLQLSVAGAGQSIGVYASKYIKLPRLKLTGDIEGMTKKVSKVLTFEYYKADTTIADYSGYLKMKWQGSSSVAYEKKNYTITLYSDAECTTAQNIEFATDWGSHNKYCLKANFIDHTHVRNIISAKLWGECVKSRTSTSTSYQKLNGLVNGGAIDGFPIMLFLNDNYIGLYTFNIPKEDWLFGMTGVNTECVLSGEKWDGVSMFYTAPIAENIGGDGPSWDYEIEPADPSWVLASLQTIYTAIQMPETTNEEIAAKTSASEACVDVDSVIDYALINNILGITDNLGKNQLIGTFDGVKWFMSAYDLDTAFGNYWEGKSYLSATSDVGSNYKNNGLTFTVTNLFADRFNTRRRYLLENIFTLNHIMEEIYNFYVFIPSELLNAESVLYPSMPNANDNGLKQIHDYLEKRLEYKANTFSKMKDETLTEATSYIWLGYFGAQKLRIQLDYPTSGIGAEQDVEISINGQKVIALNHASTDQNAFFEIELKDNTIISDAINTNRCASGIKITDYNTLSNAGISATSIPVGTHIRVWALG